MTITGYSRAVIGNLYEQHSHFHSLGSPALIDVDANKTAQFMTAVLTAAHRYSSIDPYSATPDVRRRLRDLVIVDNEDESNSESSSDSGVIIITSTVQSSYKSKPRYTQSNKHYDSRRQHEYYHTRLKEPLDTETIVIKQRVEMFSRDSGTQKTLAREDRSPFEDYDYAEKQIDNNKRWEGEPVANTNYNKLNELSTREVRLWEKYTTDNGRQRQERPEVKYPSTTSSEELEQRSSNRRGPPPKPSMSM